MLGVTILYFLKDIIKNLSDVLIYFIMALTSIRNKNESKPQDSFGELDKLFLDLQKVQYIIRKHN